MYMAHYSFLIIRSSAEPWALAGNHGKLLLCWSSYGMIHPVRVKRHLEAFFGVYATTKCLNGLDIYTFIWLPLIIEAFNGARRSTLSILCLSLFLHWNNWRPWGCLDPTANLIYYYDVSGLFGSVCNPTREK